MNKWKSEGRPIRKSSESDGKEMHVSRIDGGAPVLCLRVPQMWAVGVGLEPRYPYTTTQLFLSDPGFLGFVVFLG